MKKLLLTFAALLSVAMTSHAAPFWIFLGTENDYLTNSNGVQSTSTSIAEIVDAPNDQITIISLGFNANVRKFVYTVNATQSVLISKIPYNASGGFYTTVSSVGASAGTTFSAYTKGTNSQVALSDTTNGTAPINLIGGAATVDTNNVRLIESAINLSFNAAFTKATNNSTQTMNGAINLGVLYLRNLGFVDSATLQ